MRAGNKMRTGKWAAALVLLVAGGWWWMHRAPAPSSAVQTAIVDRGDISSIVSATGKLRAVNTFDVGSQLSGNVTALFVDFNSPVHTGQLLARIDPTTYAARVAQARAQVNVALAIQRQKAGAIDNATAVLKDAQLDYESKVPLLPQGFVAKRDYQKSQAALHQAEAGLSQARAELVNAIASVAQAKAGLDQQLLDFNRTYIRAPVDGVVIDRQVNLGQTVAASLQAPKLFTIAQDLTKMRVEATVDEADIGQVHDGYKVDFTVDAYPDRIFHGSVQQIRISGTETANVVTYTVIIDANNPDLKLLPDMTANVTILTGEHKNILRVPNAALRFTPPRQGAAESGSTGGSGAGGGGGRPDPKARLQHLQETLNLSPAQTEQIGAIFKELGGRMRVLRETAAGGSSDAQQQIRQLMDNNNNRIRSLLNPEQQKKFDAMIAERRGQAGNGTRRGTLWVRPKASGRSGPAKLEARHVLLGLANDSMTEIVRGDVHEGDEVAIGSRPADQGK